MPKPKRPIVKLKCVAAGYQGPDERIIEVAGVGANGAYAGCLVSVRQSERGLSIEIYRRDKNVTVTVGGH